MHLWPIESVLFLGWCLISTLVTYEVPDIVFVSLSSLHSQSHPSLYCVSFAFFLLLGDMEVSHVAWPEDWDYGFVVKGQCKINEALSWKRLLPLQEASPSNILSPLVDYPTTKYT